MTTIRRKRVSLPVLAGQTDHVQDRCLGGSDRLGPTPADALKAASRSPREINSSRHRQLARRDADHLAVRDVELAVLEMLLGIRWITVEPAIALGVVCACVGAYQQYVTYRAASALTGSYEPRTDVPRTRGDCPDYRPCDRVRCRHFLWLNTDPAGRPGLADVPRDVVGRTISVRGDFGPKRDPELEPRWLEHPPPPSCALDVADGGMHSATQVGDALGRHVTLAARAIREALANLRDRGVTGDDLRRLTGELDEASKAVSVVQPRTRTRAG